MDLFATRRAALSAALVSNQLEGLFVTSPANIRYLTGFTGSNGVLLTHGSDAIFFTDPRYAIQASQEVSCPARVVRGPLLPAATALAVKKRFDHLGCERDHIRFSDYQILAAELDLKPYSGLVEGLRLIKSAREIEKIRRSVLTNSKAFERAVLSIKPGLRENTLAAKIDYFMRRLGAEKPAFDTIVATGVRAALPHAHAGATRIEDGHLILIDMGAMQDGYASDMTRMVHVGRASKKTRDTYSAVLDAQLSAIAAVRPGVTCQAVDRAARESLKSVGLDRAFVHSTGHGLGLEIHEDPRIGKRSKVRLAAGMVITIEPGVYLEGWGGIRIEDTVVVTETGCEVLTPTPKELREV